MPAPVHHSSLTRAEAAIMELWDAHHTIPAIARATGFTRYRVRQIVSNYHDSGDERAARKAAAAASARLLAALRREMTA